MDQKVAVGGDGVQDYVEIIMSTCFFCPSNIKLVQTKSVMKVQVAFYKITSYEC